jgi:general secretion pathway protein A
MPLALPQVHVHIWLLPRAAPAREQRQDSQLCVNAPTAPGGMAALMYEAYFGLRERPFSIAPDPRYLYLSPRHREALAHLLYGIHERGGFVQLTGEVGTGKTTLTRALLEQLPADVDIALILNPALTVREFLIAICEELGIELPRRSHSPQSLMEELTSYLLDAYARGRHTVVLVDEAQNLSSLVLEQVRLLTNLETTKEKLLQIILVGQPELRSLLQRPELRQVAQRVTARYHLTPLSFRETRQYIQHRTAIAGVGRPLFSHAALRAIHSRSKGIPRLINVICDRALLGAYANRRNQVGLGIALQAAREVMGEERRPHARWVRAATAAALLGTAGAGLAWLGSASFAHEPAPAVAEQAAAALTLGQRLARGELSGSADGAFADLFRLWGSSYLPSGLPACEQASLSGLRCYYESGSWQALRARNLPAVIELRDSAGGRHWALLRAVEGDEVQLEIDNQRLMLSATEVAALWAQESVTLWRPPAAVKELILPGSKGPAVEWLVRRLDQFERRLTTGHGGAYGAELQARVRAFQQARGLTVDGVVGESTLMHLLIAAPDADAPLLSRN